MWNTEKALECKIVHLNKLYDCFILLTEVEDNFNNVLIQIRK